jgi:hypothetical protein
MNILNRVFALAFGLAFGGFFLLLGKHALLSQDAFLRLWNKFQKTEQFGVKPFDLEYFGGKTKLRLLGLMFVAVGVFIVVWVAGIVLRTR